MSQLFWRILIAAITVVLLFAALPPFLHILGLSLSADLFTLIRVCVAAVAIFYVLKGPPLPV